MFIKLNSSERLVQEATYRFSWQGNLCGMDIRDESGRKLF